MYRVFSVCSMLVGVVGISTGLRDEVWGIFVLGILSLVGGVYMYRTDKGK